jgi:hypothetical protein
MPGDGFVTSGQWKNALRLMLGRRTKIMSHDTDTIKPTTADAAAAPLDLLLTDIAVDSLRRLNPGGGSGPAPSRGAGQQAPVYRQVRPSAGCHGSIAMSLIVTFILLAHLSRDLTGTRAAGPVR